MKKIFILGFFILLAMPLVLAEEEIATLDDIEEAGMTPDNPLYSLDLLLERVEEMFNEDSKLNHARERLAEMKVMMHQNKISSAERARGEFTKLRLRIKEKDQIEEHTLLVNNLGNQISSIASDGKLTESKRIEIKNLIFQHRDRIQNENKEIAQIKNIVNNGEA